MKRLVLVCGLSVASCAITYAQIPKISQNHSEKFNEQVQVSKKTFLQETTNLKTYIDKRQIKEAKSKFMQLIGMIGSDLAYTEREMNSANKYTKLDLEKCIAKKNDIYTGILPLINDLTKNEILLDSRLKTFAETISNNF